MENQKVHARKLALAAVVATVGVAVVAALALPANAAPLVALAIPFLGMGALEGLLGQEPRGSAHA